MMVMMGLGNIFDQTLCCAGEGWGVGAAHSTIAEFCAENSYAQSLWAEHPGLQKMAMAPDVLSNKSRTALLLGLLWVWK